MQETWQSLTERRISLTIKEKLRGLTEKERKELTDIGEFIDAYVELFYELHAVPGDDIEAITQKTGVN